MKIYNINSAEYIKGKFIDFQLLHDSNVIIGNEIMYGTERRLVDLVLLKNNRVTAIEIKSNNDNLKRIKEQITEYKKIFNYIILVVTAKHLNKILEFASNDIGIFVIFEDSVIKQVRKPLLQKNVQKDEILYSINSRFLRKNENPNFRSLRADEIRKHYEVRSTSYIQSVFFKYLEEKISPNFRLFTLERGVETHIEDLSILSATQSLIE